MYTVDSEIAWTLMESIKYKFIIFITLASHAPHFLDLFYSFYDLATLAVKTMVSGVGGWQCNG